MPSGVKHKLVTGQNGFYIYEGIAAFTTTGGTYELEVPFNRIQSFSLNFCGTPAADEILSINETVDVDAVTGRSSIVRDSSGNVTVTRTGAAKTSGIAFSYRLTGK